MDENINIEENKEDKRAKFRKELFSWVRVLVIAVICGVIINYTIIASAHVISGSMESTVMTDSRVMGLRMVYWFSDPGRFDIILFHAPDGDSEHPYVKRIIGLPNEKIEIVNGKVYVNDSGFPLDDSFIKDGAWGDFGPVVVPENSYFVIGDNRNGSVDSRHWENTFVPRRNIIAKLYFEYFPSPQFFK